MGIFSKIKHSEKFIAMFDIGSGSVGGSLVRFTKDESGYFKPHIIAQARTLISFQEELDFDKFFYDMKVALQATAEKLYAMKKGAPDEIFCTLGSPWYVSETRSIHVEKTTPFLITQKLLDDMIQKELKITIEFYKQKYEGEYAKPQLLESKILHSSLNGYSVSDPIGKRSTSVDMNLFISLSPDVCIKGIEESIKKVFHHTPISYSSFVSALFITARDRYISTPSYLLIDVNAEITDVAIASNNVLAAMISFPMGKNYLIRLISKSLNKDEEGARSTFRLYASGMLEGSEREKLTNILKGAKDEWKKLFQKAILTLPKAVSLPSTIFLVADNDAAVWFKSVLEEDDFAQFMVTNRKFVVITVEGVSLLDMCKVTDGICDQFLMVEAISKARSLS